MQRILNHCMTTVPAVYISQMNGSKNRGSQTALYFVLMEEIGIFKQKGVWKNEVCYHFYIS